MRVIAGLYRSRILTSPPGTSTRPTSDRLRETLFNILAPRIPNAVFADLYSGTGAVGIEALSRGARHVFFAETDPPALKSLRTNLAALKIAHGYTLNERGVMPLLQKLTQPLDLIFLDPPYDDAEAYTQTLGFLGSPANAALLKPETLIIAEHATRPSTPLPESPGTLTITRRLKQGDTSLTFYIPSASRESPSSPGKTRA